jgi:hypothetical protein
MALSDLTPGEKQYLESGGQDAAAFLAENASTTTSEPVVPSVPAAPIGAGSGEPPPAPSFPAEAATEPAAPEAPEPGEEEIPAADGKSKRRVVDSRALREERTKRQTLENELRAEREMRARIDERLKLLTSVVEQPEPVAQPEAPEAPIDPEADIFGAYRQLKKELEEIKASTTEMQSQTQVERQTSAMVTTYRQDAAQFRAKQSDFNDAYNFLLQKRGEQLRALGYGEPEIATSLYNEEMNLAQRALSLRQSPAQQLYALAQSMGYAKAPQPASPAPAPSPVQPAPQSAPVAPQVASVTAEIDRIKAGQNASRSLSQGGGAAGEELSLETLSNMPMAEFQKFMDIPGNREKVEIAMGRRAA